jgi:hypothetical protein
MNCTCSKQAPVNATILWILYQAGNVVTSYVSQKKKKKKKKKKFQT